MGWHISYDDKQHCIDFRNANFIKIAQRASKYLIVISYNNSSELTMEFDSKEERDHTYAIIRKAVKQNNRPLLYSFLFAMGILATVLALYIYVIFFKQLA